MTCSTTWIQSCTDREFLHFPWDLQQNTSIVHSIDTLNYVYYLWCREGFRQGIEKQCCCGRILKCNKAINKTCTTCMQYHTKEKLDRYSLLHSCLDLFFNLHNYITNTSHSVVEILQLCFGAKPNTVNIGQNTIYGPSQGGPMCILFISQPKGSESYFTILKEVIIYQSCRWLNLKTATHHNTTKYTSDINADVLLAEEFKNLNFNPSIGIFSSYSLLCEPLYMISLTCTSFSWDLLLMLLFLNKSRIIFSDVEMLPSLPQKMVSLKRLALILSICMNSLLPGRGLLLIGHVENIILAWKDGWSNAVGSYKTFVLEC